MNSSALPHLLGSLALCLFVSSCTKTAETSASTGTIRLCDRYRPESLVAAASSASAQAEKPSEEWRFDGPAPPPEEEPADERKDDAPAPNPPSAGETPPKPEPKLDLTATRGFEAFLDVADLKIDGGLLTGKSTSDVGVLRVGRKPSPKDDAIYAIEVRMRASAGTQLGASLSGEEKLNREAQIGEFKDSARWAMTAPFTAGDAMQTVTILCDNAIFSPSIRLGRIYHLFLQPTDAKDATFAIESIRFVTRREHLASIQSGPSWQGLGDVFRQSIVLRAGQSARFDVDLPPRAWLDLAIGAIVPDPVRFEITVTPKGGAPVTALKRTVTTPERWEDSPVDLAEWSGRRVTIDLAVRSDSPQALGCFGTAIVRSHGAVSNGTPVSSSSSASVSPARKSERVASASTAPRPQGVVLMICDTLRRDHLDAWSYGRPTAPTIAKLASEGARCKDAVSQATWTKVSVPAILSSLYPQTHGIVGPEHRLPNGATTVSEVFQDAGYATFSTSSVAFSGKASNLQQGVDVLHERASVGELQHSSSKTARTFVDRTLAFIESHKDVPFFVVLHVFDPHSPFEPYAPYSEIWSTPESNKAHEKNVERLRKHFEETKQHAMDDLPRSTDLEKLGIDKQEFLKPEYDMYDESIRAMDAEVARMFERLEGLGLRDKTLFAFVADHGEEFLEHGRHFHGQTSYGELTDVPMMFWGPAWVKPGVVVEPTVQTIDLVPTLLDLAGLAVPASAQGWSLAPLVAKNGEWGPYKSRAAFSQALLGGWDKKPEPDSVESFSIIKNGFHLVHNGLRPEGYPEFELFDHVNDPLNAKNLAAEMPERVQQLSTELELWKKWAIASRASIGSADGKAEAMTPQEMNELQQLGYVK